MFDSSDAFRTNLSKIPTGISGLDEITGGGLPSVLISFEESASDLACDVASLGIDLQGLIGAGKLIIDHVRIDRNEIEETGEYDLEGLFVRLDHAVRSVGGRRVVLDTVESLFGSLSNESTLRAELRRLLRWLKDGRLTTIITGERGRESLTRQRLSDRQQLPQRARQRAGPAGSAHRIRYARGARALPCRRLRSPPHQAHRPRRAARPDAG